MRIPSLRLAAVVAAAFPVAATPALAADREPVPKSAPDTAKERKEAADYVEDSVLTARVKTALLSERSINAIDINVDTEKRQVALSGLVENEAQRRTAAQVASSVPGVSGVKDRLSARPPR